MEPTTATKVEETAYPNGLSISELISAHPRVRLFVHPLLWTWQHLSLLGCKFSDNGILSPPPPTTILPSPTRNQPEQYSDTNLACALATSKRSHSRWWGLTRLLKEEWRVADLPCKYFASSSQSPPPLTQLGYLHLDELARERRSRRRHLTNNPNPYEDPYLIALLIALAQE
ncbi:hypothetical protein B0T26DRAFT_706331 [Lasiosphaeria miniovina]|uniref:Uncharacterized protein n=1 Tax=Lasiosphaeria miniovina TaxID=1954250 RepID=A0AA40E1C2_9PEZI|nr:uncharacterized protein B0T26DRAFT_706331 [Lasiosphaeria miniovina]KAK0723395.1 hypothetical protein B0T26DRAFT_706331 [Lasiosphaeria miniovina]